MAQVISRTSPSTFGSLVARGLTAAARAVAEVEGDDLARLVVGLQAGIEMIERRGGAAPGEKTFLDALVPALEAARTAGSLDEARSSMRAAAIAGTEQSVDVVPRHGRAAWVGSTLGPARRRLGRRHPGA